MLTKLHIRNFKTFDDVEIELGQNVVFIGPNNSGKTTALQALMLWYEGLQSYLKDSPLAPITEDIGWGANRINRYELANIIVPENTLLWHNLKYKNNVHIEISVQGQTDEFAWTHSLVFMHENPETLITVGGEKKGLTPSSIPRLAFLPPMSGLIATEDKFQRGGINRRIGEGRTAEVLRNICYNVYEGKTYWQNIVEQMRRMFGVEILPPEYFPSRGEIRMSYKEASGIELDISAAGRGMLQMLLLLAYLYDNPGTVLLLDEPDAHLEILRQREVYQLLTDITREMGSQLIIATHSEVIMNEAGEQDMLIAFVGKPHRIDDRAKYQVAKALKDIRFDDYYLAIQTGWVLYLEGSTDLAILQAFAKRLQHTAEKILAKPFMHEVEGTDAQKVREHFYGLREAKPDLVGISLFDRMDKNLGEDKLLKFMMWKRREIENYLSQPETLLAYAETFGDAAKQVMQTLLNRRLSPDALGNFNDVYWLNTKISNDFLTPLFDAFFAELKLPNLMRKTNFHILAQYVPVDKIDPEVVEKLDVIVKVAESAKPGDAGSV